MARYSRMEALNAMLESGLLPIFYEPDAEKAKRVMDACVEGGARLLELTNRGDLAWRVFTELVQYAAARHPGIILGAGSVVDAPTAALYINCGADFIVAPNLNEDVARLCNRRKVPYIPGCGTVSEISRAEELGAEIVKIFPVDPQTGPQFVKALRGPMPWTRIMPTGGVAPTRESISEWISAGAAVLGMGSKLIPKKLVAEENFVAITQNVRTCLKLIKEARS